MYAGIAMLWLGVCPRWCEMAWLRTIRPRPRQARCCRPSVMPSPMGGGGGCEIRTHGQLPVGSFQDCWFKPLTQTSASARFYTQNAGPQALSRPWVSMKAMSASGSWAGSFTMDGRGFADGRAQEQAPAVLSLARIGFAPSAGGWPVALPLIGRCFLVYSGAV